MTKSRSLGILRLLLKTWGVTVSTVARIVLAIAGLVLVSIAATFAHDLTGLLTGYRSFGDVVAVTTATPTPAPITPVTTPTESPATESPDDRVEDGTERDVALTRLRRQVTKTRTTLLEHRRHHCRELTGPSRRQACRRRINAQLQQVLARRPVPAADRSARMSALVGLPRPGTAQAPTAAPTECPTGACPTETATPAPVAVPADPVTAAGLLDTHLRASWLWTFLVLIFGAMVLAMAARRDPPPGGTNGGGATALGAVAPSSGSTGDGDGDGDGAPSDSPPAAPVAPAGSKTPVVDPNAPVQARRPGEITTAIVGLVTSAAAMFGVDDVPEVIAVAPFVVSLVPALVAGLIHSRDKRLL